MNNMSVKKLLLLVVAVVFSIFMSSCGESQATGLQNTQLGNDPDATPSLESKETEPDKITETLPPVTEPAPETIPPELLKKELVIEEGETPDCEALRSYLEEYPNLELLDARNVVLTSDEYVSLFKEDSIVKIITKVNFEGSVLDLSLSEIDISGKYISNKEAFDQLVSHVPSGIKFVMCNCGYGNDEMAALRDKHTNLEFAWRVYLGRWNLRTDDEAFSVMIYDYSHRRMTSADIEVLKYCTKLKALDVGHQAITDISVIGQLTELRVLILADNWISDLTPLANLKNLEYLELFVNNIADLSPVAECTNLVDLNFGWNWRVSDISCLYSLEKIERLWLPTTSLPYAKRAEVIENFPDATIIFADKNSISSGWRTHERYFSMRGMFTNNKYDPNFIK